MRRKSKARRRRPAPIDRVAYTRLCELIGEQFAMADAVERVRALKRDHDDDPAVQLVVDEVLHRHVCTMRTLHQIARNLLGMANDAEGVA